MGFELRWYQEGAVQSLFDYFSVKSGNPIIACPTGTGKSIIIAEFIKRVLSTYPGQRIMLLTHVKELIQQDLDKLLRIWPMAPVGVYSAGLKRKEHWCPVTFGGIASVAKNPHLFGCQNLLLIDECHLVSNKANTMYTDFIAQLKAVNPFLKVIGLTATQYRMGSGLLTDGAIFTDTAYDITDRASFARLVSEGFMAPLITKRAHTEIDISSIPIRGGDFVLKQLQSSANKIKITKGALEEAIARGENRRSWLFFTTGIEHTEDTASMLNYMGIPATSIHSKLPSAERDRRLIDYKAGRYRAAVNNNVLTTGFDFPNIDLIDCLRPTASTSLWVQLLGRGTRPAPGKENCLVLDHAGNTRRLGPIDDPVIPVKRKKGGGGDAPIKVCEKCSFYNHASARFCVYCGYEFHRQVKFTTRADTKKVMGGEEENKPKLSIDYYNVDRVIYRIHEKQGKVPSLKVTYHSGLRVFHEWVCLEHNGFARRKAISWWWKRASWRPPETVVEAMNDVQELKVPSTIKVQTGGKFDEIVGYTFAPEAAAQSA